MMITLADLHKLVIFAWQLTRDSTTAYTAISNTETITDDFKKWLKQIIPIDYLQQALTSACGTLNSRRLQQQQQPLISLSDPVVLFDNESTEVASYLMKDTEAEGGECQVLVLNINEESYDCPGMIAEDKVLKDFDDTTNQITTEAGTVGVSSRSHHNNHHHHHRSNKHTLKVIFHK